MNTKDELKQMPLLPDGEIDIFLHRRVCARCYGELKKKPAEGRLWSVSCPVCGDTWNYATVSRKYAERLGQQALGEYYDVKYNPALRDLFGQRHVTDEQILAELGF